MYKILVMGLPGAGKTYLSHHIVKSFQSKNKKIAWINADDVRTKYNDWDFSLEGRIRQSKRMRELADSMVETDYVLCDFVAPLPEMRYNFSANWTIWVDTITQSRFEDTNKLFVSPDQYDFRITEQHAEFWSEYITTQIIQNVKRIQ